MEITATLLSGQTTNIDLTKILYTGMMSVWSVANLAHSQWSSAPNPASHDLWKEKKVHFPVDVSTNQDHWFEYNGSGTVLSPACYAYRQGTLLGGCVDYDFTQNDTYPSSPDYYDPQYFVDNCITLFYYATSSNTSTVDTSVNLYFPPIIYYRAKTNSTSANTFETTPVIGVASPTYLYSKNVELQSHPYAAQGYSFSYNGYNAYSNSGSYYTWSDYSGNCDLSFSPANASALENYSPVYSATAPYLTIGFKSAGLSFFTRDNVKCYNGYSSTVEGWVELKVAAMLKGQISYKNKSYDAYYRVNNLKIRIIKVQVLDQVGAQKFFIGTKYPNSIHITNPTGELVNVKEVWLGNVKVWPSGYDFNNPDSSTNADLKIKLTLKKFDFYLASDPDTKIGQGITDGSVYVSIGYVIQHYTDGTIYNVHQAAYDNLDSDHSPRDFNTCSAAKWLTAPYFEAPTATLNSSLLELKCNDPKIYRITYDKGTNSNLKHSGCGTACQKYFTKINQFTPISISLYFCCAYPKITSTSPYRWTTYNATNAQQYDLHGYHSNSPFPYKIKLGKYNYDTIEIYRFGSKEIMTDSNIVYKGANVENWKNLYPGYPLINTYNENTINSNDENGCKGYLNTIKKSTWHLGSLINNTINIDFNVNIYAAPKNNSINPQPHPQPIENDNYPDVIEGNCRYEHNSASSDNKSVTKIEIEPISLLNASGNSINWTSGDPNAEGYTKILDGYAGLYVGVQITGRTYLTLYMAKECHSRTIEEKFGGHVWTGNYEEALSIVDFYGHVPTTMWTTEYETFPDNTNPKEKHAKSYSLTTGRFTQLSNLEYSNGDGKLVVTVRMSLIYKAGEVHYTAFLTTMAGSITSASFITYYYTYCSSDGANACINQKEILTYNRSPYEYTVVSGAVSSHGGYNYGGTSY